MPCDPEKFGAAGLDWQSRAGVATSGLECTRNRLGGTRHSPVAKSHPGSGFGIGPPAARHKAKVCSAASPSQIKSMLAKIICNSSLLKHRKAHLLPMRSFEVIAPEANRPHPRLHPKRRRMALIGNASVCFPDKPGTAVAKLSRFGCVVASFKADFHRMESLFGTPRGKLEALRPLKLDQVGVDGEPHNSSGPPLSPGVVRGHDELAECQGFLLLISSHKPSLERRSRGGYRVFTLYGN
jgi:hypothetical protein